MAAIIVSPSENNFKDKTNEDIRSINSSKQCQTHNALESITYYWSKTEESIVKIPLNKYTATDNQDHLVVIFL